MRICVIGAGLFGCTAAIYAARAGHDVHLFEAKSDIMQGATAGTYSRLHRGYHYARSPETGVESRRAEASFRAEYGEAVIDGGRQFYIVPDRDSHVTVDEYRDFLDGQSLAFSEEDGVFQVEEPRINLAVLQQLVRRKVRKAGVKVHLGYAADISLRDRFDRIIVAAYAGLNDVLDELGCPLTPYKFQVVEKPVVELPAGFKNTSMVVIDGPFGCVDPLDDTPFHVLGHVVYTIHAENVGFASVVPAHLRSAIDRGIIARPKHTKFAKVVEDLARFIPEIDRAKHIGSQYCIRAVLAHQEKTDARPTLTERIDGQVFKIFSGKLGTCVSAAMRICDSLEVERREAA